MTTFTEAHASLIEVDPEALFRDDMPFWLTINSPKLFRIKNTH